AVRSEDVAQYGAAIELAAFGRGAPAQQRPQQAAEIGAAIVVALQRAEQVLRALGLRSVLAQSAQQQWQRGAHRALRLGSVGPQLLGQLLHGCALQLCVQ